MDKVQQAIKHQLENTYDIPFCVETSSEYRDLSYTIWPENDLGELFEIKMLYRQGIRLIIDIYPQKYAAGMLSDMQSAGKEKVGMFLKYIDLMRKNHAKVEMSVNQNLCDTIDEEIWQQTWKNLRLRINVIPDNDDQNDYETKLFSNWSDRAVGMMLTLLNIEKLESAEKKYHEGGCNQILINKYERNPINRQLCLLANGYKCKICDFDFEKQYGKIGHEYIHVHHIEKISSYKDAYYLNPETDLIPVCPNCHAMLHREDPPMRPEALIEIIKSINDDSRGE